jgi:hypothetical protein
MLTNPFSWLFGTRKINVNSADSTRNLAIAIGEVAMGRSYDLTANPAGSFRALNLDPQVKILTGAPAITQPLYGANLKIELNGTTGTGNKTGGVFAINAYSLITGAGHTVDKNVGMSVLADVGGGLTGTTVTENTSLEVVGVATKGTTTITNARSLNVTCPNHGANRRGILIAPEQITGLAVGTANCSFENLGTSRFTGAATFSNNVSAVSLSVGTTSNFVGAATFSSFTNSGTAAIGGTLTCSSTVTITAPLIVSGINSSSSINIGVGAGLFAINADITSLRLPTSVTPASAAASGVTGDVRWDANFLYVCTATNTWKRTALSTW